MKRIFITVDVECHNISAENLYIYGRIGNKRFGIEGIMDIAERHNIPINFFVNVVERHKYGDQYVKNIIETIMSRGFPVYLHLHPSCVKQDGRPFFWQYTDEEQLSILKQGFEDYKLFTGSNCNVIRVGSYSSDNRMYNELGKIGNDIIDLSYCFDYKQMCHYKSRYINSIHKCGKVTVFPNTRYCSFTFFGKKKYTNLDICSSTLGEMKAVISSPLSNYICTMHSWNLLKFWFYKENTMKPNYKFIKKMDAFITFAKDKGFVFSSFSSFDSSSAFNEDDQDINLCKNFASTIRGWINMFFRMRYVARTNKKYLIIFISFYSLLILLLILILFLVFWSIYF